MLLCVLATISIFAVCLFHAPPALAAETIAGPGATAGLVDTPSGIAIDQSSGTVYVADTANARVDEFNSSGHFALAFGYGVLNGAAELQTCNAESGCQAGIPGAEPGQIKPASVAVDPSSHDLYVFDFAQNRVEKFTPAGQFVVMFGKEVNQTKVQEGATASRQDLCTAEDVAVSLDVCGAGVSGVGPGQFDREASQLSGSPMSVSSDGSLYVGNGGRIEQFDSAGEYLSELVPSGLSSGYVVGALAIDGAGNFYAIGTPLQSTALPLLSPELLKFDVHGAPVDFTATGTNKLDFPGLPEALTLGGSSTLFVGDGTVPYRFLQFDTATGLQSKAFGFGEALTAKTEYGTGEPPVSFIDANPIGNSLAVGPTGILYSVSGAPEHGAFQAFAVPSAGPEIISQATAAVEPGSATLKAIINSENHPATYHVQYISQAGYEADGDQFGSRAVNVPVPDASLSASFENQDVEVAISALSPSTVFYFRFVAEDSESDITRSEPTTFETRPSVEISGSSAITVTDTTASLEVQVDPFGIPAEYRLVYGTSPAYGAELSLGSGASSTALTAQITGLEPDGTYHYRFVAVDTRHGTTYASEGPDRTFETQPRSPSTGLPDGRDYQQVSPVLKNAGAIKPLGSIGAIQAAASGDALTYVSTAAGSAEPRGHSLVTQILATSSGGVWASEDLTTPHSSPTGVFGEYQLFSDDLSLGLLAPLDDQFTTLAPEVYPEDTEKTPYLRHDSTCAARRSSCFEPLLTGAEEGADVPPGTKFGDSVTTVSASPDLRHLLLRSTVPLTSGSLGLARNALYEYSSGTSDGGKLKPVSVLPPGEGGGFVQGVPTPGAPLLPSRGAVSTNGSRVFWSVGQSLYVRDVASEETMLVASRGEFQGAADDGGAVFYVGQSPGGSFATRDLYECRIVETQGVLSCETSDLTVPLSGGEAGIEESVAAIDETGNTIYFAASSVLTHAPNARGEMASPADCEVLPSGTCNLYEWHRSPEGSQGTITFIATLSSEDRTNWLGFGRGEGASLYNLAVRTSPNGRYFAFMSELPLVGYDNRDARSDVRDQEVYLFDSATGALTCPSCNPTGARPRGLQQNSSTQQVSQDTALKEGAWFSGRLPVWSRPATHQAYRQPRYLSNSGRLFFNSTDGLVPQDTDGTVDSYEFEPPGVGSCAATSDLYSSVAGGCIYLLSSGSSSEESTFVEASEDGDDVFILSSSQLSTSDQDRAYDIYDAHVCSASSPCVPLDDTAPVECQGDACQPSLSGPEGQTPGSLNYVGPGNVPPARSSKPLTKKHHKAKRRPPKKHGGPRHRRQRQRRQAAAK